VVQTGIVNATHFPPRIVVYLVTSLFQFIIQFFRDVNKVGSLKAKAKSLKAKSLKAKAKARSLKAKTE